MKKIVRLFTTLFLGVIISTSCIDDFRFGDNALDKLPGAELTIDTIFSKAELARQHLWGLYHYLGSAY